MKNLLSAFLMLAFVTVLSTSCTAEDLNDEQNTELATGKDEATSSGSESNELPDNSEE